MCKVIAISNQKGGDIQDYHNSKSWMWFMIRERKESACH